MNILTGLPYLTLKMHSKLAKECKYSYINVVIIGWLSQKLYFFGLIPGVVIKNLSNVHMIKGKTYAKSNSRKSEGNSVKRLNSLR